MQPYGALYTLFCYVSSTTSSVLRFDINGSSSGPPNVAREKGYARLGRLGATRGSRPTLAQLKEAKAGTPKATRLEKNIKGHLEAMAGQLL